MILSTRFVTVPLFVLLSLINNAEARCPFSRDQSSKLRKPHRDFLSTSATRRKLSGRTGDGGIPAGGYTAVMKYIQDNILTTSKDFWPADFADTVGAHYGGLMIRLAWHCSGSYRSTDGRGGCDGGRIRHDPEISWPDNANIDMALKLLDPVKEEFGSDLSWGDLIILAGNAAIKSMGGPVLGFCGGRIDDVDGSDSLILGPSPEQEELTPCQSIGEQGDCKGLLGPTEVGNIYVNPAGHEGDSNPEGDIIKDIRSSFGKMGMNETEIVALVGGGHAFGKCHGACDSPPCGSGDMLGKGLNTVTSGFEGAWTTQPTTWTNQYFTNLFAFKWNLITGPGGKPQWKPENKADPSAQVPDIIMLTSDIAFMYDEEFKTISEKYADDIGFLADQFQHAWYKLTTSDMGRNSRCLGDDVPDAQAFQTPLPSPPEKLPDFIPVRENIQSLIDEKKENRGIFIDLAMNCASTFRVTDYDGGCNGAFTRFEEGSKDAIDTLKSVKDKHSEVSYADIIVLAGQVALEDAGSIPMSFCGGRVDAPDASARAHLQPIVYRSDLSAHVKVKDSMVVKGLTFKQGVALAGTPDGTETISNKFFIDLIAASDANDQGTFADDQFALVQDDELKAVVKLFAVDEGEFKREFVSGWSYLMNADQFDGPRGNMCSDMDTPTISEAKKGLSNTATALISVFSTLLLLVW